ncbi:MULTISPECIES: hypothetical protein [unclassified Tatumella]|uniref:hypothetical protein n=1 Tax=unclassified Tatumella TaxID=2649542 RepID=UPI001BAEDCE9|nr:MULTISPECIES: hypothetical protein [unclassified Tatumella]MBS0856852.1 hypothetical protein [Tatumella sp. JGM16]MBS0878759.1 hypothetical protein [Tatumella sp. JGM82]MBS0890088.1 hypothetical protein [Tatumella sp. JGM94]MBS0901923.1 hypothetical protein [Tatumella sp. JGM100]MBS0913596.1 hypothetical protein [Tatumella sp. JGM91]
MPLFPRWQENAGIELLTVTGYLCFYQSQPAQPVPVPEQHAQAVKNKTSPPPEPPKKKSLFDKVSGLFFAEAKAMPPPPFPIVMDSTAKAGMAAATGGATTKPNQDAARALTHTMKRLSGPEIWRGRLAIEVGQGFRRDYRMMWLL